MSLSRLTLPELQQRILSDLEAKTRLKSPFPRTILKAFSYAQAGVAHMLYGFLEFIAKQAFPTSCNEATLQVWAYIFKVPRKPASFSRRIVKFKGSDGSVVEAGTVLKFSDGIEFEVEEEVFIQEGFCYPTVTCLVAGKTGNIQAGFNLRLVSPISGINSTGEITPDLIIDGQDQEEVEAWRERIILRIQSPPHGGTPADYKNWALEIPGVTRAWPYENYLGIGFAGLTFVNDADTDIFPNVSKVQEVQDKLNLLKSITAQIVVFAPIKKEISFHIQLNPNNTAVQDAVTKNLRDLFRRESEPGGYVLLTHIAEQISLAAGEHDHFLVLPIENVVSGKGELAVVGEIFFENIS